MKIYTQEELEKLDADELSTYAFDLESWFDDYTYIIDQLIDKKETYVKKHGFSRIINDVKFTVFFEYFQNQSFKGLHSDKVIKCTIIETYEIDSWDHEDDKKGLYFGVAKLDPRDTFDRDKGEEIAFIKALNKWDSAKERKITNIINKHDKHINDVAKILSYRLNKIQVMKNEVDMTPTVCECEKSCETCFCVVDDNENETEINEDFPRS